MSEEILRAEGVQIGYDRPVIREVTFSVRPGEVFALAGESGSGKSTLLRAIMGVPGAGCRLTGGRILFRDMDLTRMAPKERHRLMGGEITMIFQDPGAAFNPIRTYRKQFAEMLKSRGRFRGRESYREIEACFERLKLPDAGHLLDSCPYEMSGGMNQRIAVAAAMLLRPALLLADEPTSALDAVSQRLVLSALLELARGAGTAILLVTHNLGVAAAAADALGILREGRLVECGGAREVLARPRHPYTKSLIDAVPVLGGAV